jgi:SAM-dependent methyltransferase
MSSVSESSAGPADQILPNGYDSFAEGYTAENEANLINGYYARPAILTLAGDVTGRRILDAGCGSGPLFAVLRDGGAIVSGFDKSAAMLELARRRLGPDADLRVADLGRPLPYAGGASAEPPELPKWPMRLIMPLFWRLLSDRKCGCVAGMVEGPWASGQGLRGPGRGVRRLLRW